MAKEIIYPSSDKIIEFNVLVLNAIDVKKADKAKVLSKSKIEDVLEECEESDGDIYDKSIILLKGLIKKHPFASGNRRTAFIALKYFLVINKAKFKIKDEPRYAKTFQGIREDYYSDNEIKEWIKNGQIRQFKR